MNKTNTKSIFFILISMVSLVSYAKDTIPPTIVLNNGKYQNVFISSVFVLNEPKQVNDNLTDSSDIILRFSWLNGQVNTLVRGTYPLVIEAEDTSQNISRDTVYFKVDDFYPPSIDLNTPSKVCTELGKPYNRVQPSVSDNYYSNNQITLVLKSSDVNINMLGLYTDVYEATDGSGNKTTATRIVEVKNKCQTNIDNFTLKTELIVAPNPANETINLYSNLNLEDAIITIFNYDGTVVLTTKFKAQIDVSELAAGLYILKINNSTDTLSKVINISHF